ncbi:MAG: hypothetical protein H7237_02225 [Alkalinema sp. FL-bin-369]|nr:hypothetical protein [Leptolyngbyaceae cyanobacterium LF-bin-369]
MHFPKKADRISLKKPIAPPTFLFPKPIVVATENRAHFYAVLQSEFHLHLRIERSRKQQMFNAVSTIALLIVS